MAKFNSRPPYLNLKLVLKAPRFDRNTGQAVPGKTIQFNNGEYETTKIDELKALRDPKNGYGAYIYEEKPPAKPKSEAKEK